MLSSCFCFQADFLCWIFAAFFFPIFCCLRWIFVAFAALIILLLRPMPDPIFSCTYAGLIMDFYFFIFSLLPFCCFPFLMPIRLITFLLRLCWTHFGLILFSPVCCLFCLWCTWLCCECVCGCACMCVFVYARVYGFMHLMHVYSVCWQVCMTHALCVCWRCHLALRTVCCNGLTIPSMDLCASSYVSVNSMMNLSKTPMIGTIYPWNYISNRETLRGSKVVFPRECIRMWLGGRAYVCAHPHNMW